MVRGSGRFVSPNVLEVMGASGSERIRFEQCIIAAGSEAARLPGLPDDPRIIDSTGALELPEFSGGLLVVGGGIIGLEMACVYDALGAKVSVVELTGQLMPGCDPDLVRPLERRIRSRYQQILLNTKVAGVEAQSAGLRVSFAGDKAPGRAAVRAGAGGGRSRAERQDHRRGARRGQGVASAASFRSTSRCAPTWRTSSPSATSSTPPLLAHKAMHEGKVAAEVAAGHKRAVRLRASFPRSPTPIPR